MDVVTGFATLFHGNTNAYGTEEGGCDKDTTLSYYERVIQHLEGDRPMGVYPMFNPNPGEWGVNWGCIDFDEGEETSLAHALNVVKVMHTCGVTGWVERSRSKGYHVWVFIGGTANPTQVREALLGACQVVDAPTKEINPKSVTLAEGQFGNYVRLPYPGGLTEHGSPTHRVVLDTEPDTDLWLASLKCEWFVEHALETRCNEAQLENLRALYQAPVRVLPPMPAITDGGDMHRRMSGLAWTIYEHGPINDMGRGHTLFKMACVLAEAGKHRPDEILALCLEADARWGKFHTRGQGGQATIEAMVRKAMSG